MVRKAVQKEKALDTNWNDINPLFIYVLFVINLLIRRR